MSGQQMTFLDALTAYEAKQFETVLEDESALGRADRQRWRVYAYMRDHPWCTVAECALQVQAPTQSVSARMRDLRKKHYGAHTVIRRSRKGPDDKPIRGLYEYKLERRWADANAPE